MSQVCALAQTLLILTISVQHFVAKHQRPYWPSLGLPSVWQMDVLGNNCNLLQVQCNWFTYKVHFHNFYCIGESDGVARRRNLLKKVSVSVFRVKVWTPYPHKKFRHPPLWGCTSLSTLSFSKSLTSSQLISNLVWSHIEWNLLFLFILGSLVRYL